MKVSSMDCFHANITSNKWPVDWSINWLIVRFHTGLKVNRDFHADNWSKWDECCMQKLLIDFLVESTYGKKESDRINPRETATQKIMAAGESFHAPMQLPIYIVRLCAIFDRTKQTLVFYDDNVEINGRNDWQTAKLRKIKPCELYE